MLKRVYKSIVNLDSPINLSENRFDFFPSIDNNIYVMQPDLDPSRVLQLARMTRRNMFEGIVDFVKSMTVFSLLVPLDRLLPKLSLPTVRTEAPQLSSELDLEALTPNVHTSLTNLSMIPESLFHHSDNETLGITVNFSKMYKQDKQKFPQHLNLDPQEKEADLWRYGRGIKAAIERKQQVFLVVELPGGHDQDVTLDDWRDYIGAIAREYPASHIIIGNEINIDSYWKENPIKYAQYFIEAAKTIKSISLNSKVLIYGEAYYGNGEVLEKILAKTQEECTKLNVPLNEIVDGLSFHFYDLAQKLPDRTETYRTILNKYQLPDNLYLTELGKAETAQLDQDQHVDVLIQNLSTALALASQDKISDVLWHTSYNPDDPHEHSLSYYDALGKLNLRDAFKAFWLISRCLHHDIVIEKDGGVSIIRGKTSNNDQIEIVWNNLTYSTHPQVTYYQSTPLPAATNPYIEGKTFIVRPKVNPQPKGE